MKIEIKGASTRLVEDSSLIQNSAKQYPVEFTFDEAWDGFAKTALFEAGGASIAVVLTDDRCVIPAECLKRGGVRLKVMVYGVKGTERISTGWCTTSVILHKASLGFGSGGGPTLPDDVYDQIMAIIGDLDAAGFEGKTLAEVFKEILGSVCETATYEEVGDALDSAFGESSGPSNPPEERPENTATDKEVSDILDDVFGR